MSFRERSAAGHHVHGGPGQHHDPDAAGPGKILVFGRGDNPINFVAATDVAALIARAVADPGLRGQAAELGASDNLTFNRISARNRHRTR